MYILCWVVGVSPPNQILAATKQASFLHGSVTSDMYEAVDPVTVNAISRLMYWYDSSVNSVMVQSLDGDEISVGVVSPFLMCTHIYTHT